MKKSLLCLIPCALCLAAQEEPIRITVYASRIEDDKADMPVAVQTFDAAEIAASGARDLPDLLEKKASIDIHRLNANPIQSEIAMRGFGENAFGRVKVIVDGEELNNVDLVAPNLMRVPLANVARVEILRGPSPVLYGDGAVAGVVNISTDARDYESRTRFSAGGVSFSYVKDLSAWGYAPGALGGIACLFVQKSNGQWVGGTFDWISSSRRSRDFNNLYIGYEGWSLEGVPNPCQAAFVIVSPDGKRRSNVIAGTWNHR